MLAEFNFCCKATTRWHACLMIKTSKTITVFVCWICRQEFLSWCFWGAFCHYGAVWRATVQWITVAPALPSSIDSHNKKVDKYFLWGAADNIYPSVHFGSCHSLTHRQYKQSYLCVVQESIHIVDVGAIADHHGVRRDSGQITVLVLRHLGFAGLSTQQLEIFRLEILRPRLTGVTWTMYKVQGLRRFLKMVRHLRRHNSASYHQCSRWQSCVWWKLHLHCPTPNTWINRQTHTSVALGQVTIRAPPTLNMLISWHPEKPMILMWY